MTTINMQLMRYINLLDKASHVKTMKCFIYNNTIYFAVPRALVSRAVGQGAENIRKLQEQLGKRVRIIAEPSGTEDAERFVSDIVNPIKFKSLAFKEGEAVISASTASKASLIGRNKRRLEELSQIVKDNFNAELKII